MPEPEGVNKQLLYEVRKFHDQCQHGSANEPLEHFFRSPDPNTACQLFDALLRIHGKKEYKVFLNDLADIELASESEWQRDHVVHSCLVYCVGVYLYMSFGQLRKAVNAEMRRTETETTTNGRPQFSEGDEQGEFGFRWRLAALCHDIAYPIEMIGGTQEGLRNYLPRLNRCLRTLSDGCSGKGLLEIRPDRWFDQLDELPFAENTALGLMGEATGAGSLDLRRYWWMSLRCGLRPDHGIASAVLIHRMADLLFDYHYSVGRPEGNQMDWNPKWLVSSIPHALAPIAYHNLTPTVGDSPALEGLFAARPLIGLLRMSDALQDWDRRHFHADSKRKLIPASHFSLEADTESGRLLMRVQSAEQNRLDMINGELRVLPGCFPVRASAITD